MVKGKLTGAFPRLATSDGKQIQSDFSAYDQPALRPALSRDSAGYRSGRSFERDTPVSDSSDSTRSAGTCPDFAHLRTASYPIPSLRATDRMPPPDLIASETVVISSTVQPIVAFGQQPIRVSTLATLQPMVVKSKAEAKKEFSSRLAAEIKKRFDVPERGLVTWLFDRLSNHVKPKPAPVSYETCRKWLKAKEIPIPANLMLLCDATGIQVTDLMDDELRAYIDSQVDPEVSLLMKTFKKLNNAGRKYVLDAAEMATKAESPPVETEQKKSKVHIRRKTG